MADVMCNNHWMDLQQHIQMDPFQISVSIMET